MEYTFEIPGILPTLNQYVNAERANRFAGASMKKKAQEQVMRAIVEPVKFEKPVEVFFTWIRPDMRSDCDNVAFAKKFILDALQQADVISRDSWKLCKPYDKGFYINKANPRTIVTITDEVRTSISDIY